MKVFFPGQFTLFAPTDLAFNQFLQKLGGVKEVKYGGKIEAMIGRYFIFNFS